MAGKTRLRIGLGYRSTAEEVDDGALAGAGPTHHRYMERRGGPFLEERSDTITNQGRRQAQLPRQRCLTRLVAAVLFQPAEVFGQLVRQSAAAVLVHSGAR